jgi:pimeloyl-ACP methyl ester carboxylesterase
MRATDLLPPASQLPRDLLSGEAGPLLGGLLLGIGAGVALERVAMRGEALRSDPEADEPFGALPGAPATVTSWDGTELHVEELGAGPCLVFGHGFSLNGNAWHYQRRDLPAGFRCVFLDHRGHGRSERPESDDYSIEAIARDLAAVIEWTVERRLVLVAHSMSGIATLRLCELRPDLVRERLAGIVLVSALHADVLKGIAAAASARAAQRVQLALATVSQRLMWQDPRRAHQLRRRGSDMGYIGTRLFGFGSNPSPRQVDFTDRLLAQTPVEVWSQVFRGLLDFDFGHVLESICVPTLVAAGDSDRLTPPAATRHVAESIPDARLVMLPDSGHMAFMEEHELLDREIAAFARELLPRP